MSSNRTPAENLAQAILQVAQKARSEEDLRVGVEQALSAARQALGLTARPEYEKTTFSGSADAVYGHVTIEYKRPGRLASVGCDVVGVKVRYWGVPGRPGSRGMDKNMR